ncbi:MAG TPA: YfhO family protein [Bryobacteraceae bacterium]|nr:YfhO family protein [Bryobacteraceae bacterium]
MSDNFKDRLRMAFVLLAVVAGFYWKLTLTRQFDWAWTPDLATQVLPWFQEQARFWGKGTIPLWDSTMWAGQPFLGQAQPGAAYPLNWVLFALPLHKGYLRWDVVQWYFVVLRFMAVGFCYWLCRDLGRSRLASVLAAIIFGLGGYIGATDWPQMVNGALWLPLVFLFLLRAVRTENTLGNAALSGMFMGIAWLSGHHQAPMFIALAAAGAWIYFIFRSGKWDWHFARAAAVAMLFMGLTGALQILPAYEYGHLARRWVGDSITWSQPVPYSVHQMYDLRPQDLPGLVFPYLNINANPMVGVAALALAFLGLAMCWKDPRVRLLSAVGLGGLLYALGHFSVFQGFLYGLIPELDKARVVSAAIFVFEFGVAVLAAFGLDQLGSAEPSPWPRRVMWAVLAFAVVMLAVLEVSVFNNKMVLTAPDTTLLVPFLALGVAALLYASIRGNLSRAQVGVLLILMVLMELGNNTGTIIGSRTDPVRTKFLDQMRANADVAGFLKQQPGFFRATVPNDAFPENWGEWHGIEMWTGYLASVTLNMTSFDSWTFPARMLFGVAYTIADKPTPDGGQEVFAGASGMKVYKYAAVFPRAWAVHRLQQAHDSEEGKHLINERVAELHDMAFLLQTPPPVETCSMPDKVELVEHVPNRVSIQATMGCKGMVILSDTFFPGWHATIDGNSAPIYEVNEAMRGVLVPAGNHTLTFQYWPFSVIAGFLLTLAGIGGAIALGLRRVGVGRASLKPADKATAI